jgi:hypothetical protein
LRSATISPASRFSSTIRPGPDPAQQLVLADHSPRLVDQRHQQVEGAAAESYRPAFGEQLAAMRQDAEVAKSDDRRRVRQADHGRRS